MKTPYMKTIRICKMPDFHISATQWCMDNLGEAGYIIDGHKWRRDFVATAFEENRIFKLLVNIHLLQTVMQLSLR